MLFFYNYIKNNRSFSITLAKIGLLLLSIVLTVSTFYNYSNTYAHLLFLSTLLISFILIMWQLVFVRQSFDKNVATAFVALDSIMVCLMLLPLTAINPFFPVVFLYLIFYIKLLLPRSWGEKLIWATIGLLIVSIAVFSFSGVIEQAYSLIFTTIIPAVLINFLGSFSYAIIANLLKDRRESQMEMYKYDQENAKLKRELFLNSQLVDSLYKDVRRRNIEIKNILSLSGQVNVNADSRRAVESSLYAVIGQTGSRHAFVLTQERKENNYLSVFAQKGVGEYADNIRIYRNSNLLNIITSSKEPFLVKFIPRNDLYSDEIKILSLFKNDLICPIYIKGKLIGVMFIGEKLASTSFKPEDINIVSIVANQIAYIMEQSIVSSEFQDVYFKTIKAMMKALEAKYVFARGHTTRTANYVNIISEKIGLNSSEVKDLTYGTLLHDVGKIAIRDKYLLDSNVFKEDENLVKRKILEHTLKGAMILKSAGFDGTIVDLALHHHENFDGKGFPHGLGGSDLSFETRILSVCNTFDAMTSDRPHRKALSNIAAREYLEYNAGKKFDPEIVKVFLSELSQNKEMQKFH